MIKAEDFDLEVKKWNHDSTTNILEIQTNQNCKQGQIYQLNIFIAYRNYGTVIAKNSLDSKK